MPRRWLPLALSYTTITGTFDDGSGTAMSGTVSFTPSAPVYATGIPVLTPATPVPAQITNGVLENLSGGPVKLLATDNAGLSYPGLTGFFYWTVTVTVGSQVQPSWSFFLPSSPSTVDLYSLAHTAAGGGGGGGAGSGIIPPAGDIGGTTSAPAVVSTHLVAPLPIAQGGTAAATQQAAINALTGTQALGKYLRSDGTNASLTPIQAADLPAATTSAQGVVILDGTTADIQPIGTQAAGTVGKAADAGHVHPRSPWQFAPEAYGAKRDGAYLYDAAMTSGSAVLTTAGLPAPAAPSPTTATTGGAIVAGVYQAKITYVNAYGETLASTASSVTTTGSSSTITIPSPAPWTNATGWYAYVTQPGGSTFYRQQAPGSPTPLRTALVLAAPPTNTGANPPVASTSNSAPFTANDVGKAIMVPSAGGFLNVPLATTIASYQSATQVTLTANATSTVTGSGAVYGTDDTSAIQQAINAAVTYAQQNERATGEVVFGDGIYCVAGAPGGTYQNAQITIPYIDPYVGPKVNLKLTGPQESHGPVHWEQPNPPAPGATLASIYYNDSSSPPSPHPVVIGGPVTGFGGTGGLFSNMRVVVDGLNVLAAYRPSISGLDLFGVAQADIKSFSMYYMARTATAAGGWPSYIGGASNPSAWQTFAYRTPTTGNNAQNDLDRLTSYGPYHGVVFADHFNATSIRCLYGAAAATAAGIGSGTSHQCTIASLVSEQTNIALYNPNDGVLGSGATQAVFIASLQAENAGFIIQDAANALYGEVHAEMLGTTGVITNGKSGAANIRLIWDYQPLGTVASPPAVPGNGTAYTNQFWRDATVYITSGGAAVSAIAVDGITTGATLGTTGTVAVRVPNGQTITLTYTSTAPTWAWVLE